MHNKSAKQRNLAVPTVAWFILPAIFLHSSLFLIEMDAATPPQAPQKVLTLDFYQPVTTISAPAPASIKPAPLPPQTPREPTSPPESNELAVVAELPTMVAPSTNRQIDTAISVPQEITKSGKKASETQQVETTAMIDESKALPSPESTEQRANRQQEQENATTVVSSHIKEQIASHFRYPFVARRKGWEGEVLLGFQLNADGTIERVEVIRSSGRNILDSNAKDTLQRIGSIDPQLLQALNWGGSQQLALPISYRLNKG